MTMVTNDIWEKKNCKENYISNNNIKKSFTFWAEETSKLIWCKKNRKEEKKIPHLRTINKTELPTKKLNKLLSIFSANKIENPFDKNPIFVIVLVWTKYFSIEFSKNVIENVKRIEAGTPSFSLFRAKSNMFFFLQSANENRSTKAKMLKMRFSLYFPFFNSSLSS